MHIIQAEAYQQHGPKAFQVPLTAKPRLYDTLLEASRTLPLKPVVEGGRLQGQGIELLVLGALESGKAAKVKAEDSTTIQALFDISDGSPRYGHNSYDPIERIWRWLPAELGPYETAAALTEAVQKAARSKADGVIFAVVRII